MIRHYESLGLLKAPRRTEARLPPLRLERRSYAAVRPAGPRRLGFSMKEIEQLLGLWQNRRRSSVDVRRIAQRHIVDLEQKIHELESMRGDVEGSGPAVPWKSTAGVSHSRGLGRRSTDSGRLTSDDDRNRTCHPIPFSAVCPSTPARAAGEVGLRGPTVLLLQPEVSRAVSDGTRILFEAARPASVYAAVARRRAAKGHALRLSNGSGNRGGPSGRLPDVWHGARARPVPRSPRHAWNTRVPCIPRSCRSRPGACPSAAWHSSPAPSRPRKPQPRASRHDAPFLDCCRSRLPVLVFTMGDMSLGLGHGRPARHARDDLDRCSCCATPIVLWAGWPFLERGWHSIVTRHLNMFTLIALGVGAAYVFSVAGSMRRTLPGGFRCMERRDLIRHRGGDYRAGATRSGAGAASARADRRAHAGAAWHGAANGAR